MHELFFISGHISSSSFFVVSLTWDKCDLRPNQRRNRSPQSMKSLKMFFGKIRKQETRRLQWIYHNCCSTSTETKKLHRVRSEGLSESWTISNEADGNVELAISTCALPRIFVTMIDLGLLNFQKHGIQNQLTSLLVWYLGLHSTITPSQHQKTSQLHFPPSLLQSSLHKSSIFNDLHHI